MKRAAHTPSPWSYDPEDGDITSGWMMVAKIYHADDFPLLNAGYEAQVDTEAEANAHLISAAPDLLAAAKAALREMRNTVAPRASFTEAVDALDAAISKAEVVQ